MFDLRVPQSNSLQYHIIKENNCFIMKINVEMKFDKVIHISYFLLPLC